MVGYQTKSIAADTYYLLGTQFKSVNGAADSIAINDLVKLSGVEPKTFSTRSTGAQLLVRNGNAYTYYYFISDATGGDASGSWARSKAKATDTLNLGQGFWLKTPATVSEGATVTFAGEVKEAEPVDLTVGSSEYVIINNPYPVPLTFDMITTTGITPKTFSTRSTGAQILVRSGNAYIYYYYISDATGGSASGSWARTKAKATGTLVGVGEGFWVKSSEAATIRIDINAGN